MRTNCIPKADGELTSSAERNSDCSSSEDADSYLEQADTSISLPAHVIVEHIGSFLDRQSLNALRMTCREVMQSMNGMPQPWPVTKLPVGNKMGAQSLAFCPDGSLLACRGRGGIVRVWNQQEGKQLEWSCRGPLCFGNVTFSSDNELLACDGNDKMILLYEVETGKCIQTLRGHQGAITSLSFSPVNSNMLASGSTDSNVMLWDRSKQGDARQQAVLTGHIGAVYSVAMSHDGQALASGGTDRILRVWNISKVMANDHHQFCEDLEGHTMVIVGVAFSERLLVSASLDMTVRLWVKQGMANTGSSISSPRTRCIRILKLNSEALTLSISPSAHQLAVGTSKDHIQLWDLEGILLDESKKENSNVCSAIEPTVLPGKLAAFGQQIMATSGKDGFVQLHSCS